MTRKIVTAGLLLLSYPALGAPAIVNLGGSWATSAATQSGPLVLNPTGSEFSFPEGQEADGSYRALQTILGILQISGTTAAALSPQVPTTPSLGPSISIPANTFTSVWVTNTSTKYLSITVSSALHPFHGRWLRELVCVQRRAGLQPGGELRCRRRA